MEDAVPEFVYVVPLEKFVYRSGAGWEINSPVGKEGIRHHLLNAGHDRTEIEDLLKTRAYYKVHGWDLIPNAEPIFRNQHGLVYINTWTPPDLEPLPGPYPTIERLFAHLTCGDVEGQRWLKHWIANKIQNPALVPKVAILFGTTPGAGKGTLAAIIRRMLGEKNTAVVKRGELENKFNSRWIDKLFVLADEVVSGENMRDLSEMLKVLIDGGEIELEAKHQNQRAIRNRLAWIFASNDKMTPIAIHGGDRRYTVFNNHAPLEDDYVRALNGCFSRDRSTPTPEFLAEISAFYHDCLTLEVDTALVARPHLNEDREALIEANLGSQDEFFQYVNEFGVDDLLEGLMQHHPVALNSRTRPYWDFGAEGLSAHILYRCYVEFCLRNGRRPVGSNRLGIALRNLKPAWPHRRRRLANGQRVYVYLVPRATAATDDATPATDAPAAPAPTESYIHPSAKA